VIPDSILHYKVEKKLGEGGMGEVFLATDTRLDRKVALKFLPPNLTQDSEFKARFEHEAKAAAALNHPNIVTVYELNEHAGRLFIAMEHVEGRSLEALIAESDLPLERTLDITRQVCDGLSEAHQAGIVHRDIKPSNIMVTKGDRAKILDFGLAKSRKTTTETKTGTILGTLQYQSPEQCIGKPVDTRSDLFAVGAVLYEMITGQPPFAGDMEEAVRYSILNETQEPLARFRRDAPAWLESMTAKLLEKNPSHRYQTAAGVLSDLDRFRAGASSDSANRHAQPSVAVLPFANLSADPEQEHFCDGMAEEIINALTHIKGLRVVARTSCFAFKNKQEDIREIGRKLNVDHVLEGSVRRSGKRVRITGQLVKVTDGYHLWSDRFDRDLEDVFEIQDEISQAIANTLDATLLHREESRTPKRHTTVPAAYGLYLRGRWLFDQRTERSIRQSIDCYTQAIAKDPGFAPAYVGLSFAYCELPQFGSFPQQEALGNARPAAAKALEIDAGLAEAHTAMGVILAEFAWDWAKAEAEYKTALHLKSSSAETRFWYALLLLYLGRLDDAVQQMQLAQELDPLSVAINKYFGLVYLCCGRHEAAEKTLKNTIEMAPRMTYPRSMLGLLYLDQRKFEDALRQFQEEEEVAETAPSMIEAWKAFALVGLGRASEAQEIQTRLEARYGQNRASPYAVASTYFALADLDRGFEWLNRAVAERDYWLRYLKVDPTLQSRGDDPRLKELLTRIGVA
jgi:serine/threonine protein kinase/Tfp pilus assembly protein PilF